MDGLKRYAITYAPHEAAGRLVCLDCQESILCNIGQVPQCIDGHRCNPGRVWPPTRDPWMFPAPIMKEGVNTDGKRNA